MHPSKCSVLHHKERKQNTEKYQAFMVICIISDVILLANKIPWILLTLISFS